MENKRPHLLMVSLDAVDSRDVDFLLTLPNFSALCRRGTLVRDVSSVFISNTYPAHTSIITGTYPKTHGIFDNVYTQPGRAHPDWQRDARKIRVPTLYSKAAEAGLSVCSVLYPVSCYASSIQWNIAEVADTMSIAKRAVAMLAGGTPDFTLSAVWNARHKLGDFNEPGLDNITTSAAAYGIRRHRPDLTLLHLIDVDHHKHDFGPNSDEVKAALRRHDERLGSLLRAMRETFREDEINVILFSDHGCLKVHTAIDPNTFLKQRGIIRKPAKSPQDFDAFFHNAGGTTFLKILRPEKTAAILAAVDSLLKESYIRRRLSDEEMDICGMKEECVLGLEAEDGYCFGESHKGQHGYSLRREDYHPFYFAAGPGIAQNSVQRGGCIIDICPLAADILKIPKWNMDGRSRVPIQDTHGAKK